MRGHSRNEKPRFVEFTPMFTYLLNQIQAEGRKYPIKTLPQVLLSDTLKSRPQCLFVEKEVK